VPETRDATAYRYVIGADAIEIKEPGD